MGFIAVSKQFNHSSFYDTDLFGLFYAHNYLFIEFHNSLLIKKVVSIETDKKNIEFCQQKSYGKINCKFRV